MASFFSVLGSTLRGTPAKPSRPPNCHPIRKLFGAIAAFQALHAGGHVHPFLPDNGLQPAACSQTECTRASYTKGSLRSLAGEALSFKEKGDGQHHSRYWQTAFLLHKHGAMMPADLKCRRRELRAALREVSERPLVLDDSRRVRGPCVERLNAKGETGRGERRRRKPFARERLCPELDDEVWAWFVDRLQHNKTRIYQGEITRIASSYCDALRKDWVRECDDGRADPTKPPALPKIDKNWVERWRRRFNVTVRTVNLRYKIPRVTFLSRLQVFWSNCIITRTLHQLLHPGKDLHFAGFDQKPLWFNSILAEKTLSVKGRKKVAVAENVSASRARFTAMTQTRTWLDGLPPAIGILFKIGDAACSLGNLRASLECPPNTLIQGGAQRILPIDAMPGVLEMGPPHFFGTRLYCCRCPRLVRAAPRQGGRRAGA